MQNQQNELVMIIEKFADSGWDLIDAPSKAWLRAREDNNKLKDAATDLISAIEKADQKCGSCGCEFDPLYKKVLVMKDLLTA